MASAWNIQSVCRAPHSGRSQEGVRYTGPAILAAMLLWVLFAIIVLSASGILWLSFGPFRGTAQVLPLRLVAAFQYLLAAVLAGARLLGKA